jgi:hypothetical protein
LKVEWIERERPTLNSFGSPRLENSSLCSQLNMFVRYGAITDPIESYAASNPM